MDRRDSSTFESAQAVFAAQTAAEAPWHPHNALEWTAFVFGGMGGALAIGAALGLIPLVVAQVLEQRRQGNIAFFSTLAAGAVGGMLLALPASIGFLVFLLIRHYRGKRSGSTDGNSDKPQ